MKTMKLKLYICLLTVAAGGAVSCHGDLNIAQKSQITSTSMWKIESDAISAVNGAYAQFRTAFSGTLVYYGDYRTNLYGGGMMSDPGYNRMASNTITRDIDGTNWVNFYTAVNDCNLILKYAETISFSNENKKGEVIGNAYFLRAYIYFWMVRVWGKVPLLTTGFESDAQDDLFPFRDEESKVYAQIESDIDNALTNMPASVVEKSTATKNAINMLKADYFLWKAKVLGGGQAALQSAKTAVDAVLTPGDELLADFEKVFTTKENAEVIWALHFDRTEFTGGYPSMYLIPTQYVDDPGLIENPIKVGSHQQYISVTDEFEAFLAADPADSRTKTSFMVYQHGDNRFRWINKYCGEWLNATRVFSSDLVLYRMAEAYLFKAEVENALGNTSAAIAALNEVAKRAYGTDNYYPATLTAAQVDQKIVDETMKEFVVEGKIWWAYIRFGVVFDRVASLAGRQSEKNVLLWPVASATINGNPNIAQTEGYN